MTDLAISAMPSDDWSDELLFPAVDPALSSGKNVQITGAQITARIAAAVAAEAARAEGIESGLQGSVTALAATVASLEGGGSIGGSLATLASEVSTLSAGLSSTEASVTSLGGSLSVLETEVAALTSGSSSGTFLLQNGTTIVNGSPVYNRPQVSGLTLYNATTTGTAGVTLGLVTDISAGSAITGPLVLQSVGNDTLLRAAHWAHGETSAFSLIGQLLIQAQNVNVLVGSGSFHGIILFETSSGKAFMWGAEISADYPACCTGVSFLDGAYQGNSGYDTELECSSGIPMWWGIDINPTAGTFSCWVSGDKQVRSYRKVGLNLSSYFSGVPDRVGIGVYVGNKAGLKEGLSAYNLFVTP